MNLELDNVEFGSHDLFYSNLINYYCYKFLYTYKIL